MLTAIEVAKAFGVRFSLEHAWGATDYMDEIVESGCDICYGPIGTYRCVGERRKVDIEAVKTLDERGVTVALITDSPILSEESLYHHIGEAVREGRRFNSGERTAGIGYRCKSTLYDDKRADCISEHTLKRIGNEQVLIPDPSITTGKTILMPENILWRQGMRHGEDKISSRFSRFIGNCVIRKDYKKQLKERAMSVIIQSGGNAGTKKNGNIRE